MAFQKRGQSGGGWKGGGAKSFGDKKPWDKGGSRGPSSFGGGRGGDRGGFGGNRGFDKPEMHRATCAACNQACQVPFKPNGSRPIYCSNCFGRDEDRGPSKPSFRDDKPSYKPSFERPANTFSADTKSVEKMKEQFNILNSKLDILIKALVKTVDDQVDEDAFIIDAPASKKAKVVAKKKKVVEEEI
jgi:CxxC-x17-CxxC domain-containing protein